jgi:hypothetical protein
MKVFHMAFDDGFAAGSFVMEVPMFASQYLECLAPSGERVARASGFFARNRSGTPYLVTNRHVVTAQNWQSGAIEGTAPSAVRFSVPLTTPSGGGGFWAGAAIRLGGDDWSPRWLEHHQHGGSVDVVAIPLDDLAFESLPEGYELDFVSYPVDGAPAHLGIANDVFVIGFPVGARPLRDGAIPIWTRGSIAWPPRLEWHGRPCFLIDSRTRSGQSGAPAVFFADQTMSFIDREGNLRRGPAWGLVGVYGGRIHRDSDIGIVWKGSLVEDLVEWGTCPRLPTVAPLQLQVEEAARFDESDLA